MGFIHWIFEENTGAKCSLSRYHKISVNHFFQLIIMASTFFQNINNLTTEEIYRLSKLLNKYVCVKNGCHTWHGEADRCGYGQFRITFRGARIRLKAHRVMFAMANPNITLAASMDVSHLCHNKLCVSPEHLSYEPYSINNNRMVCKNEGECHSHHGFKDCML